MDDTNKKRQIKHGLVQFSPGQPMQLKSEEDEPETSLSKDQAPQHLADSISVLAIHCKDGIIIRYDVRKDNKEAGQFVTAGMGTVGLPCY